MSHIHPAFSVPSPLGFTTTTAAADDVSDRDSMASAKVVRISGLATSTPSGAVGGGGEPEAAAISTKSKLEEATRIVEVLQYNRNLLSQNIVLCDDLFVMLRDHKVIPGPMVADIQRTEDHEEANLILLQYVGRLGPRAFYRFCDVLGLTGHTFLAEHIRTEAEQADPSNRSDLYEDVFRRFPAILKVLAPGEQRSLTNYVRDKVTDGIIKNQWKSRSTGDVKLADERNKKVTDSIMKDRVIKEKDVEIIKFRGLLEDERTAHQRTQRDVAELESRCHDIQVKYNEQLQIMMNSYEASERANWEIEQRLGIFDRQIKAMNVKIQLYFGADEYTAQADASNVKVSRLEDQVQMILDQLTDLEKEHRALIAWYEEQRRKLFEALGLDDNGQDLRTAYLNAQEKINSEVRRLTAEVDLLGMTFDLNSIWSMLEAEREEKEEKSSEKKKAKGTEELKTNVNIIKTAAAKAKDFGADFNYTSVLHMVKDRLHEVHMQIEKLKRKNLEYERKVGKLQGELDLIRMQGFMDDPSQVNKPLTPTLPTKNDKPSTNRKTPGSLLNRTPRTGPTPTPRNNPTPRQEKVNPNPPLPPIFGRMQRDAPLDNKESAIEKTDTLKPPTEKLKIETRLPVVPEIGTPRKGPSPEPDSHSSPRRKAVPGDPEINSNMDRGAPKPAQKRLDPGKQYESFAKERTPRDKVSSLSEGKPVLGYTETQAKAKLKHAEQDLLAKQYKPPDLKKLDYKGTFTNDLQRRNSEMSFIE